MCHQGKMMGNRHSKINREPRLRIWGSSQVCSQQKKQRQLS